MKYFRQVSPVIQSDTTNGSTFINDDPPGLTGLLSSSPWQRMWGTFTMLQTMILSGECWYVGFGASVSVASHSGRRPAERRSHAVVQVQAHGARP